MFFPIAMSVPLPPPKHEQVVEYSITEHAKDVRFQEEFLDPINEVQRILGMKKILGGEKREMYYNLSLLKENIKFTIHHDPRNRSIAKLYFLKPTKRCMKLVKEKGFCHTQRNLLKGELNRIKNRFLQIRTEVSGK